MTRAAALHAILERERLAADRLYAVVDAARDPVLARAGFEQFDLDRYSLFPGNTSRQLATVAPFLIPVPFESKYPFRTSGYFEMWAEHLGGSGGILFTSSADVRIVWEHLRDVYLAGDDKGNEFYFRFYDPRVLRNFLPSLTAAEAKQFFGPARRFFIEGDGGTEVLVARATESGVKTESRAI
jgi:hypothetical protein